MHTLFIFLPPPIPLFLFILPSVLIPSSLLFLEGLFELSGNCLLRCPANHFSREGQCISCDGPCPTGERSITVGTLTRIHFMKIPISVIKVALHVRLFPD